MNLKVLLPFQIYIEKSDVLRIVVDTRNGSFGLLPHRLDCVAELVPGILVYETAEEGEAYIAVDEGTLVKAGLEVLVSVRNAIGGTQLGELRTAVEQEFLVLDKDEQQARSAMARLETGLIRKLTEYHHD